MNHNVSTMMLIICVLFLLNNIVYSQPFFLPKDNPSNTCIAAIIKKYYERGSDVSIIDMDSDDRDIVETIHKTEYILIVSRTIRKIKIHPKSGYIILAKNSKNVTSNFVKLTKTATWDPYTKIIIVVKYLNINDMKNIFNMLLELHVVNVLIVNNTATVDLYTYNPYENYRCGRRYDRIISLGQCNKQPKNNDLFYNKLITGLKHCVFRVTYTHYPPHAIDPATSDSSLAGLDQYMLTLIAEKEEFTLQNTFKHNADEFTIIVNDSIAVGPLRALQTNKTDIVIGAMLLTATRARVFTYLTEHIASIDYLVIQVAKAGFEPLGNILAEFRGVVWFLLLIVFVVYSSIFFLVNKKESKGVILLKMFGYLLLQSNRIRGSTKSKAIIIFWIFFAYLMNCYYQSNLVSFMTNPILEYQISSDEDIDNYNLKPCVSKASRNIVYEIVNQTFLQTGDKRCEGDLESIRTVGRERNSFAVSLLSLYLYYETDFYDDHGKPTIYTIRPPISKILYATYLYKGFPIYDKLQQYYFRVGEVGLLLHHLRKLKAERLKKHGNIRSSKKNKEITVFLPWSVLIIGTLLASIVFSMEILTHYLQNKFHKEES